MKICCAYFSNILLDKSDSLKETSWRRICHITLALEIQTEDILWPVWSAVYRSVWKINDPIHNILHKIWWLIHMASHMGVCIMEYSHLSDLHGIQICIASV